MSTSDTEQAYEKAKAASSNIAYGGGSFVSALIRYGLIDEFHLFVNPVALGKGMAIFGELDDKQRFVLETQRAFACGIVLLRYRKAT